MLRKILWFAFSLLPVVSFAAIFAAGDAPELPGWIRLLSAAVPGAILEYVRSHWWVMFVGLVAAHYCFFIAHPLFNPTVRGWQRKCAWAGSIALFYPMVPTIYALLCVGNER